MDTNPGWSHDLGVGVDEVDREHGLQVKLLDALHEAVSPGGNPAAVPELVQKLGDVSNAHFIGEELLMRLHSYPRYHLHIEEHRRLLEQFGELSAQIGASPAAATLANIESLRRWLVGHIRGMDRDFARFTTQGHDHGGEPTP